MEPAVERQEHAKEVVLHGWFQHAAMEPAVERREHMGGRDDTQGYTLRPQWSPPLKGGSTPGIFCVPGGGIAAAMEPAVERREHRYELEQVGVRRRRPQWSPPLKGGSTGGPLCPRGTARRRNGARR